MKIDHKEHIEKLLKKRENYAKKGLDTTNITDEIKYGNEFIEKIEKHDESLIAITNNLKKWHNINVKYDEQIAKLKSKRRFLKMKYEKQGKGDSKMNVKELKEIDIKVKQIEDK